MITRARGNSFNRAATLPDPSCPDLDNVVIFISVSSRQRASIVISRTCTEHPRPSHTSRAVVYVVYEPSSFYGLSVYDRTSNEHIEVEKALTDDTPDRPPFSNLFAIAPKTMQTVPFKYHIGTVYASRPEAAIEPYKWYGPFVIHLPTKEWHGTSDCEYLARLLINQAKK